MREVKTNKGRIINMQELSDMHQETRAIGNMPVNARGDVVKGDVVIKPYSEVAKTRQVVAEKPQAEEVNIKENFGNPEEVITKVDEGHILNEYEGKDGKMYQEIEFADGSIQVREMKTTTESSKKTKTKK
tara:strand:- start:913 stop:1302 length:390 start_codon:yes stop_codon:yes gene_type:complete